MMGNEKTDRNRCANCTRHGGAVNLITGLPVCFSAEVEAGDVICTNFEDNEERVEAVERKTI